MEQKKVMAIDALEAAEAIDGDRRAIGEANRRPKGTEDWRGFSVQHKL